MCGRWITSHSASRMGERWGIVGESGCGKSTMARAIVGLEALHEGKIDFMGVDISSSIHKRSIKTIRDLQMVFQDPNGVLNPSYTVGEQIAVALRRFHTVPSDEVYGEVPALAQSRQAGRKLLLSLAPADERRRETACGVLHGPIAANPAMVVCDEPVSALDVSVQAAVLNLLLEIQNLNNTSMILISHDLSAVRFFSDDVAVMYLGRICEIGPCESIYSPPNHPYTAALLAAVPRPNPDLKPSGVRLSGRVPSAVNPPNGCRFSYSLSPSRSARFAKNRNPSNTIWAVVTRSTAIWIQKN